MKVIPLAEAAPPFVLSLDLGSSSIRALVYDAQGDQLEGSETQISHRLEITADGGAEGDAIALFDVVCSCLDGVISWAGDHAGDIGAVAISCFWHGLLALDQSGDPVSPVLMWSDKRSGPDVRELVARMPPEVLHQQTGCRPHSSYWPAKMLWFRRTQPEIWSNVSRWTSFSDYVLLRLTGDVLTSLSMASGTGLLDIEGQVWDVRVLEAVGVEPATMPALTDRDQPLPRLGTAFANRWPALATVPWYPPIGDGAAANVGAECIGPDRIAITVGTSAAMRLVTSDAGTPGATHEPIPPRIWNYRLDRAHRVVGGALSNAGNVTGWIADHMAGGEFEDLSQRAAEVAPDGHGLTILPFLAGERSPSWNDLASGTWTGVRLSTSPAEIFRATLEATAYRIATIYDDLSLLADDDHEIHINGAAALGSPLWVQIIADTLGHRINAIDADAEASARGAALCALESLHVRPNLRGAGERIAASYSPDPRHHALYAAARRRQERLEAVIGSFQSLTVSD